MEIAAFMELRVEHPRCLVYACKVMCIACPDGAAVTSCFFVRSYRASQGLRQTFRGEQGVSKLEI
jgi:hypothetical protein